MNEYRINTEKIIDGVREQLRPYVKDYFDLSLKVKKVIVIVTSSRSGSSLVKTILSKSDNLAYLSGEEEPYYILTKNTFPYTKSDGFNSVKNKKHLVNFIMSDLGVNINFIDVKSIVLNWQKRILYQFPTISQEDHNKIESLVLKHYSNSLDYEQSTKDFLHELFGSKSGYYDICSDKKSIFREGMKIEEPPFVIPSKKRDYTKEDIENGMPILFKTPQDSYRIGIFEEMFPNAEIKYIHLSRGFAQTVNGLIDGWLSDTGFFAHNMDIIDKKLNIKGYTDLKDYGNKWWKFDLPPNWEEFIDKPLEDVCVNQWIQSNKHILDSGKNTMRIKFEDFLINPQKTVDHICDNIGIPQIIVGQLPYIMSTDTPRLYRWKKREELMMKLSERKCIKDMMCRLGHSMNPDKWI